MGIHKKTARNLPAALQKVCFIGLYKGLVAILSVLNLRGLCPLQENCYGCSRRHGLNDTPKLAIPTYNSWHLFLLQTKCLIHYDNTVNV
jgi:hypothetical protein